MFGFKRFHQFQFKTSGFSKQHKQITQFAFFDFSLNLFPQFINKKFYGYKIEKKGYCLASDTPETYKKTVEIVKKEKLF